MKKHTIISLMRWRVLVLRQNSLILIASFCALFLVGCGSNSFSGGGTRGGITTSGSVSPTAALGECNNVNVSSLNLVGQVSTFYSPGTGQMVPNYVTVNFTSMPSTLYTSSTVQIQLFPYSETSAGVKSYNSVQAELYFLDKLTGTTSPIYSAITLANIKAAITAMTLPSTITVDNFFARVYTVFVGLDPMYDGGTFAFYDTSVSSSAQAQGSFLLPPFYVNPNTYRAFKPAADLDSIHPFYAYIGSAYQDTDYENMDNQICQTMATGTRIPTAVGDESNSKAANDLVRAQLTLASQKGYAITPLGARASRGHGFWAEFVMPIWRRILDTLESVF